MSRLQIRRKFSGWYAIVVAGRYRGSIMRDENRRWEVTIDGARRGLFPRYRDAVSAVQGMRL